ncbi:J domain-containing protein [Trichocoleus desertorum AS-A10]|uniref:J domain-containing protein n=1 Tax=Trichocoleus desertorum TaxID=1481672 RepID=UPI00329C0CC1
MTQDGATPNQVNQGSPLPKTAAPNYYALLGLHPSASPQQIRRAYRDLSKQLHPDTTTLPPAIATAKFQQLNEAYATVSNPERRVAYDLKIGYSRLHVMQAPADLNRSASQSRRYSSSAYLDPTDRPLSPGEIFALFILGVTFVACLVLAIAIGLTRGDIAFHPLQLQSQSAPSEQIETARSELAAPSAKVLDSDANQKNSQL